MPIRPASNIWYSTGSGVDRLPDQPSIEPPSAAASSALTASSDSTAALETNAARASADVTRLSAQAACARTTGSGSESASVRIGTVSGDPQFPSPTQTLRAKPTRPARRMADPLEDASHAASSSATSSSSIGDGASVPGRGPQPTNSAPPARSKSKSIRSWSDSPPHH
jgi:hypothetical protein